MTVVHPNHIVGINSITVQTGDSLSVHKADGSLIRTIVSNTGVSTFHAIEVSKGGGDLTVGVSTLFVDNSAGRIGINSAVPQTNLDIQGGELYYHSGTGYNLGIKLSYSNGNSTGIIDTYGNHPLELRVNNSEKARLDTSGRLIVGAVASNSVGGFGGAALQVEGLNAAASAVSLIRHSNDTVGSTILMGKTRGTSNAATTVVQNNDVCARIIAYGADGTDTESSLGAIQFDVDGTPGGNDMPGRMIFSTTADGAATYTERLRIDSLGNVLIGNLATASASRTGVLVVETNNYNGIQIVRNSADASTPLLSLSKTRGTSSGAVTAVNSGDICGRIRFQGADGDELSDAAYIDCKIDAAPGNNDMAGRLMFYT